MTPAPQLASIVGLNVQRYKNLREVCLPWSDGVAVFGTNGAGKTNLLECIALLCGTERTLRLAEQRLVDPQAGDLSLDLRVDLSHLPLPPDDVLENVLPLEHAIYETAPGLRRLPQDGAWWRGLGCTGGLSFAGGIAACGWPEQLVDLLADLAVSPVVRYVLQSSPLPTTDARARRRFSRTLLTDDVPTWLRDLAPSLPDEFAPLRSALAAAGDPQAWAPLLELPPADDVPVTLEWLPRARTSNEAGNDLVEAFERALPHAETLAGLLAEFPVVLADDDTPDAFWWMHLVAVAAANEELDLTLPYISLRPVGEENADFALDDQRDGSEERGRTLSEDLLEPFSAGERRWVDEALATAARALDDFGRRMQWQTEALEHLDQAALLDRLSGVAEEAQHLVDQTGGAYPAETIELLVSTLEATLLNAALQRLEDMDVIPRAFGTLAGALPQTVVRVFDEPEAHLHPTAQRDVLTALERLRQRGNSIVLASHSPHFLARSGWLLVHAQRTPEGVTFAEVSQKDIEARKALAGQLGWSRGQLLTDLEYVLIVEGEHDRLVLETFFGEQLREAGVGMLRMHGTSNLVATADLDFVRRFLDLPVGVLIDYARREAVDGSAKDKELRSEEQQLRHLRREGRRTGRRQPDEYVLSRPDIVAYLDEDVMREDVPTFSGWATVQRQYDVRTRRAQEREEDRPSFKPWLARHHGVVLDDPHRVAALAQRALASGRNPPAELQAVVEAVLLAAGEGAPRQMRR